MKLEQALSSDLSAIQRLLADCQLPYTDLNYAHLQHFLVVRDGNQLAGTVGLEAGGKFGLLRSLAVSESYRQHGLGIQLTSQIEAHAVTFGVEILYLLTTTAQGFFAKRGYQLTERKAAPTVLQETSEFKSICPSSAVCMVKHLGSK
jgi:amino-acid N-acetyltransferase